MGTDTPLAVLSDKPQLLYNYFKQLFAQVTNPPIDCIREEIITSMDTTIGAERNLLEPTPESCPLIELKSPILTNEELDKLRSSTAPAGGFKSVDAADPVHGRRRRRRAWSRRWTTLCQQADAGHRRRASTFIILSDRGVDREHAPIPALLAVAGVHHHLIREGTRTQVGLVLETGEPREVHHFALLIGYGAGAINPYLAFETLDDMIRAGLLLKASTTRRPSRTTSRRSIKGVVKVMSKMGISTIQSYRGAQIFEAIGLNQDVDRQVFHLDRLAHRRRRPGRHRRRKC